jgi:uncharacterized membrane protein YqgA involved in biofilm formation
MSAAAGRAIGRLVATPAALTPGLGHKLSPMGAEQIHRSATRVLSLAMVAIGVALVVQAASNGGSVLRIVLGVLFVAAGVGRLYILRLRARARAGADGGG